MNHLTRSLTALLMLVATVCAATAQQAGSTAAAEPAPRFTIGRDAFLLDGKPFQIRCGEVHAARVPREYWRHRLQMLKAMGMNAVCAYMFWNMHEPRPGEFNFEGQADVAEFCRLAQEEGLWVILRPGPYACAEWTMGGLPWWLLKHDDIQLRSRDPRFIEATRRYLARVGEELVGLQVTHGGPILMVQVENEYGFYSNDAEYMGEIRQALLDAGFDVPLFACNPVQHLRQGYRDDLFPVVNFGSNPEAGFRALRSVLPEGPLMCGEFYPGWFDTWGSPHHTGNTETYLADLKYMLDVGASFSIYMAHGGTTFGLWSGADRPFKPDTSSYDYDAPISEAGWTTPKLFATRELMSNYLQDGETLPEPPERNPVIAFDRVRAAEWAPVMDNLPEAKQDDQLRSMEYYDQAGGFMVYRTTLPAGKAGTLTAEAVHDFGWVLLDGRQLGVMDRRSRRFHVQVPERSADATLDFVVEAVGRVNFGQEVHDRKGLHGPVRLTVAGGVPIAIDGPWEVFNVDLAEGIPQHLNFEAAPEADSYRGKAAWWRLTFEFDEAGDTFLDVSNWGKGVLWVNGHCLGRFWNIGPTQTMYAPGPWLKEGTNEVVILDLVGPEEPVLWGRTDPVLDVLRPELDLHQSTRAATRLVIDDVAPVHEGRFAPGVQMQTVEFATPVTGRQIVIESIDAHDGQPFAAIAELDLLDAEGQPISHEGWTVAYVSSEERIQEDGTAENAIDGQTANHWHTEWGANHPGHPHQLALDLGTERTLSGLRYVPRQGSGEVGGRIAGFRVYVGNGLVVPAEE